MGTTFQGGNPMFRLLLILCALFVYSGCYSHSHGRHSEVSEDRHSDDRTVDVDVDDDRVDVRVRPPGGKDVDVHVSW